MRGYKAKSAIVELGHEKFGSRTGKAMFIPRGNHTFSLVLLSTKYKETFLGLFFYFKPKRVNEMFFLKIL